MADEDKNKKKKPRVPGGGKPRRKDTAPAKGSAAPAATGGQANIYANDPESGGMQPLVPGSGYTDHRPKTYRGGSAQTFVNGHGLDTSKTENRNFVSEVNRHERDMFRRRANDEKEAYDRASRQEKDQRYRELQARIRQGYRDRNFDRGVFSTREGWENLGRSNGRDKDGNEVSYGRGSAGVKDYDARYEKLKKRADILTKAFETGDYTGRGKEWAAIRKLVADTHANGGLTDKQLAGIEAKMESLRGGLNERINYANKANEYYAARDIARQRKEIGDDAGILSDDQVKATFDKRKWDNVRGAVEKYGKSDPTSAYVINESGDFRRTGDRIDALKTMLDNGISATQLAKIAVNSGEGAWKSQYDKLLSGDHSSEARMAGIEDIGVAYLKQQLARGDAGRKALNDAIAGANTVGSKKAKAARTEEISWGDEATPAPSSAGKSLTPQEARTAAENEEMFSQSKTAKEVKQLGPTVGRADEDVQKAGNIAEAAANAGVLTSSLTPRDKSFIEQFMKSVPGPHQGDGSVGEVTPGRAAWLPDTEANTKEALEEAPLAPRKQATPEPKQPSPPVLIGGNTGEHAMQTVETGFDRAANKLAKKVKSLFD